MAAIFTSKAWKNIKDSNCGSGPIFRGPQAIESFEITLPGRNANVPAMKFVRKWVASDKIRYNLDDNSNDDKSNSLISFKITIDISFYQY